MYLVAEEADGVVAHGTRTQLLPVAQPLFPSCLMVVVPTFVDLMDDAQVDADGLAGMYVLVIIIKADIHELLLCFSVGSGPSRCVGVSGRRSHAVPASLSGEDHQSRQAGVLARTTPTTAVQF